MNFIQCSLIYIVLIHDRRKRIKKGILKLDNQRECGETRCGTLIPASATKRDYSEYKFVVASSRLPDAGMGLFATSKIPNGVCIGRFGVAMECGDCVLRHHKERSRLFDVLLCDVEYGEHKNDVMWHLVRSNNVAVDGEMWFVNSCCFKNNRRQGIQNVTFDCAGLSSGADSFLEPLVEVVTCAVIEPGEELLSSYGSKGGEGRTT